MKEIKTARLTLRPLNEGDLHTTFAYAGDRENARYMMFLPFLSLEEARAFLRACGQEWQKPRPEAYEYAILRNGAHVGGISLYLNDARDVGELGWILHPAHHGQGYALEAARALTARAAARLGLRRFEAHCDAENLPSRRVMEKLGMRLVRCTDGRKNRCSSEERREYLYEIEL